MNQKPANSPKFFRALIMCSLAAASLLLVGCAGTFQEVRALSPVVKPAEKPRNLVIGPVLVTDSRLAQPEKELFAFKVQQGVESFFAKTNVFDSVIMGTNAGPGQVMLSGTIQEVEKGSAAARFWVGMGAGQSRIQGDFELSGSEKETFARFDARRSYLGGSGIGGANMIGLDELATRLGQTVAETTLKWVQGKKID